jgi:hypothetical protein
MPVLSVVLAGKNGQDDIEISWSEWQRWQRVRIFRQQRARQERAHRERLRSAGPTAPPAEKPPPENGWN